MRHRRGTPGLTPYRLRTIEAGCPRRRRPARHRRPSRKTPTAHSLQAGPTTPKNPTALQPAPRRSPDPRRRRFFRNAIMRRRPGARRRVAVPHVALGVAGAITLALLIVGGYQAATGAAVMLGMF